MNRTLNRRLKWSLESTRASRSLANSDSGLASPPGYSTSGSTGSNEITRKTDTGLVIKKKLWEVALAPLKQVPMNLLIMYMAGNSISIFPVMMVGMQLMRQIQALFSINVTFKKVGDSSSSVQKLAYLLGHFINIAMSLYKCQSMGLLPTHSSDWLAFAEPLERQEYLGGGISLC